MWLGKEIQVISEGRLGAGVGRRIDDVVPLFLMLDTQLGNIHLLLSKSGIVFVTQVVQVQQLIRHLIFLQGQAVIQIDIHQYLLCRWCLNLIHANDHPLIIEYLFLEVEK